MKILLDAMGGDNAPDAVIKGAVKAAKEIESDIVLIGNEEIINQKVKEFFDKEVQFDVMLSDIYKIIGEGLREILE